ncbi:MAG: glucose-6-phosphate dehydrogenase [Acidobacteria bacterium]|nr:glucose-6-phosphate dehydrogenase [Acidobacteriota bacterium]
MTTPLEIDPHARSSAPAPQPATIVIFGGAGDLAHRKLLPALYNLHVDGLLPPSTAVVGVGRKPLTDDAYRQFAREGVEQFSRRPLDGAQWEAFAASLFFASADIDDERGLAPLGSKLDVVEQARGLKGNRIYYLAVPPTLFVPTVRQLARSRFITPPGSGPFARLVVEKPIGQDLQSAMAINDAIAEVFAEPQIFRIDHYLGKETVQNILVMRFANSLFEPLFNQKYIDHVQITVAEREGVGTRAGYYEQAGALRDMVQNHLLQLLALVAMEPPHSLDADVVRDEKLEVLQSLRPLNDTSVDSCVVRGQYTAGTAEDERVLGYRQEHGVNPASTTETFVALQTFVDNWRWAGVPFFLRTGKRLPTRASAISIQLKDVPPILFNTDKARRLDANVLTIRIQPDEGFSLSIESKVPGPHVRVRPVEMNFDYTDTFGTASPEAYERLLLDVMAGDATLFMRRDSVETSWRWITPALDRWDELGPASLPVYPAGTWGPEAACHLIERSGRRWRHP